MNYLQNNESLEFALESGRMATWEFDLKTNEISCSKRMLELWGIEPHEFKNHRSIFQNKVHPDDLARMKAKIDEAIKNQSIYELEYRIIPRSGEIRWVHSRGRCTFSPDSSGPTRFAGVVYDITDKKNQEIALAKTLEERSEFFTIAGHELKTPLTCLHLQLKVMQSQLAEISTNDSSINLIQTGLLKQHEHLLRLSRIVDNILDESKISRGLFNFKMEDCDLSGVARNVLEQMSLISRLNGVEINFSAPPTLQGTWDRYRLEQVLINLLMNAINYGNRSPIHLELAKEDGHAFITVRDQGLGISKQDQIRIFQRFQRADQHKSTSGMGLGLYISNYIVQAHGGEIRLKSEPGKGSEFTVAIPCNSSL